MEVTYGISWINYGSAGRRIPWQWGKTKNGPILKQKPKVERVKMRPLEVKWPSNKYEKSKKRKTGGGG